MKHSIRYALAFSLIAAPLVANDCNDATICTTEVVQVEQDTQPFYKKAAQKLWNHKGKIAAVSAVVLAAAVSTYILWKAGASQQAVTPEALLPLEPENSTQPLSTVSEVTTTETPVTKVETTPSENAATLNQALNFFKETGSWALSELARCWQALKEGPRHKTEATF